MMADTGTGRILATKAISRFMATIAPAALFMKMLDTSTANAL